MTKALSLSSAGRLAAGHLAHRPDDRVDEGEGLAAVPGGVKPQAPVNQ